MTPHGPLPKAEREDDAKEVHAWPLFVLGPKTIAQIGHLPDTLRSRCIVITMH